MNAKLFRWAACLGILGLCLSASAQHLQRRAFLGFQPIPVTDSLCRVHKLPQGQGVLVGKVPAEGSMAALGVQPGDILLRMNAVQFQNGMAYFTLSKEMQEAQPLEVELIRGKKRLTLKGKVLGMPRESSMDAYAVEYGEMPYMDGYVRTISRRPKTAGKHPVIYFITGYNCASVDNPLYLPPYIQLFDSLAKLGYAIYRVEKPGTGDGPHPCQCAEIGFDKELDVFAAGYRHMMKESWVDAENVFLFGHSMGGFQAPLLANMPGIQPRGIAVYGTAFQSWYEYIIAMLRFQMPRSGVAYADFEQDLQAYIRLFYAHYVEMQPLSEILANETWKGLLERDFQLNEAGDLLYRRWYYWQELAKVDVVSAWSRTNAHVLSIFGSSDFEVFNRFSMEEIARIVNTSHPGHGKFVQLDGTDHLMLQVGGMEEGHVLRDTPGYRQVMAENFDWRLVKELDAWLRMAIRH
jgi:uncharacterized protein